MISYDALLRLPGVERDFCWADRDVMLYALGTGFGRDPLDERELPFVTEENLRVVPTFPSVVGMHCFPSMADLDVNYLLVVQGEQGIVLHRPLPPTARVTVLGRIVGAVDKGDKGALIHRESVFRDASDGEPLATLTSSIFARGDGHFGGPSDDGRKAHVPPSRPADISLEIETRPDQALLYRLSGDRNPLHSDPKVARAAGFERPILHGLCTYGLTCRAVLQAYADFVPERIASHEVRFSAPVFPGETLIVDLWRDGSVVSFEARSKQRGVTVIKSGKAVLREER